MAFSVQNNCNDAGLEVSLFIAWFTVWSPYYLVVVDKLN